MARTKKSSRGRIEDRAESEEPDATGAEARPETTKVRSGELVATDAKAATVENPKNHREILAVSATAALPKANLVSTADAS